MIADHKAMKKLLDECRQPREIKQIETQMDSLKDVVDEPEKDQQIFNLKTKEEIKEIFQDGFTVHDGKTLKKLIDFSKKGFQQHNMKASTRNQTDFGIHHICLHDHFQNMIAIVFNDNKSRCELYNLEHEQYMDLSGNRMRRMNTQHYQDDFNILDSMLLGPATRND